MTRTDIADGIQFDEDVHRVLFTIPSRSKRYPKAMGRVCIRIKEDGSLDVHCSDGNPVIRPEAANVFNLSLDLGM